MKDFAKCILRAAQLYEMSWDVAERYRRSIGNAAANAASELNDRQMAAVAEIVLTAAWNESIEWAKEVTDEN
jgi:mono/diheme cytochrome c family protein